MNINIVRSDTDNLYYDANDLEWLVEPNELDPGVLAPKKNAMPLGETKEEAETEYKSRSEREP